MKAYVGSLTIPSSTKLLRNAKNIIKLVQAAIHSSYGVTCDVYLL